MLGQKPSGKIATIAGGFIYFFLAAVGGGHSHCIENNDWYEQNMLLVWPLPYMVSRTVLFYFGSTPVGIYADL